MCGLDFFFVLICSIDLNDRFALKVSGVMREEKIANDFVSPFCYNLRVFYKVNG